MGFLCVCGEMSLGSKIFNSVFLGFLLIAFLAVDGFSAVERFNGIYANSRKVIFVVEYLLAVLGLFYISRLRPMVGLPLLLFFWFLLLLDVSIHKITGQHADIFYISAMNAAALNMVGSLSEFSDQILSAFLATSVLMVPLIIKNILVTKNKLSGVKPFIIVSTLFFAYGLILILRGAPALVGFPKGYSYGFGSSYLQANNTLQFVKSLQGTAPQVKEQLVPFTPTHAFKKIIVLIDESVEYGEFLKLKEKLENSTDFGKSYSGANCSAGANYLLRRATWGKSVGANTLLIKQVEPLFSIAKKSGYKTIYFDNQNVLSDGAVHNYFDDEEVQKIDLVITPEDSEPKYLRDISSLKTLEKTLKNDDKVFIFINKVGAHFPYKHSIPPKLVTDDKMSNYRLAVSRSTISYLITLLEFIDNETVIFYTSDHGQDFKAAASHCNTGGNTSASEYAVPFLVLSKRDDFNQSLGSRALQTKASLSHLEFSESVRNILGYAVKGVGSIFKNDVNSSSKISYCGLYGQPKVLFGVNPGCLPILEF